MWWRRIILVLIFEMVINSEKFSTINVTHRLSGENRSKHWEQVGINKTLG